MASLPMSVDYSIRSRVSFVQTLVGYKLINNLATIARRHVSVSDKQLASCGLLKPCFSKT